VKPALAIVVFNRPEKTRVLLDSILGHLPDRVYVIADGPRPNHPGEAQRCAETRSLVANALSERCDLVTNYSETNLGCGRRIATGLDWVFGQVEEAIVLEDDCIPHPSFFRFCEEMLERYRDDERVVHIGGNNFQNGVRRGPYSYFFSRYNHIWGWATWRRAWHHFDHRMHDWPEVKAQGSMRNLLTAPGECEYWSRLFDGMVAQEPWPETWGYAWTYACFKNGLSIYPNVNLVSNIGYGEGATNCLGDSPHANLPVHEMVFPLSFPLCFLPDQEADAYTVRQHFHVEPPQRVALPRRVLRRLKRFFERKR
jgi:hypothetical protein